MNLLRLIALASGLENTVTGINLPPISFMFLLGGIEYESK